MATIEHHLTEFGKCGRPLWEFWCDAVSWESVSRHLRDIRASYFRLETTPGRLLVVSSEQPNSAAISGLSQVTTEDTTNRLCAIIANNPVREKQLTYSHDWKLLEEFRCPIWKGWRRIAKVDHPAQAIWEVLEQLDIDFKIHTHRGEFWSYQSWQFTDAQCAAAGGWSKVFNHITAGEVFPDFEMVREDGTPFGDGEVADEFAGAEASTGPPGGGVWLDW